MASAFEESRHRFEFDERWHVIRYDKHPDYLAKIHKLQGTGAVDFVAVYKPDGHLFFIEVKNFRGHRIENKTRRIDGSLAEEVAQNVRDSIAGIIAAHHRGNIDDWKLAVEQLANSSRSIRVLLWMEDDPPPGPRGRRKSELSELSNEFKKQLEWLKPRVLVMSTQSGELPRGLIVSRLPGADRTPD